MHANVSQVHRVDRGVSAPRLTSQRPDLGTLLSRHIAWPLWEIDNGTRVLPELREMERTQWLSSNELRVQQWQRVQAIAAEAYEHAPYYRAVFDNAGFDPRKPFTPAEYSRIGALSKSDIQRNGDALFHRLYKRDGLIPAKTGGSTGTSLTIYADWACRDRRNAAAIRSDRWAGWDLGVKRGALWGNPPVPSNWRARLRDACHDRMVYLDTMSMDDESMSDFVRLWRAYKPRVLFGHSHSLFIWALWLQTQGIEDITPVGIVSTSMMLLPSERSVIEQVFQCKVTNRYGCEEVGLIACECERHQGMHMNIEHLYVEFLRADGSPADPGEPAELVITDLINRGQPLLRYRIEDVGAWSERQCPCGRGLPMLESLTGRVADFLLRKNGSRVAGVSLIERTLTALPGIEQMQVVQESIDSLTLNVVRMSGYDAAVEQALVREFQLVFGDTVSIAVNHLERIPQLASGKYRFAICNVPSAVERRS